MDLHDTLIYRVQSLSRQLDNALRDIITRDTSINYAQYRVMVAIHETTNTSITAVANWLDLSVPTISHLCSKLRSGGYLRIDQGQGNAKRLQVTQKGIDSMERLNPQLEAALDDCLSALNGDEQVLFTECINKLQVQLTNRGLQC